MPSSFLVPSAGDKCLLAYTEAKARINNISAMGVPVCIVASLPSYFNFHNLYLLLLGLDARGVTLNGFRIHCLVKSFSIHCILPVRAHSGILL